MSVTSRVIKNSSLLLAASVINSLMSFILTLFTARYLGAHDFGLISSATSFIGIFSIFCDLGFATYAIREVSRNKEATGVYFGTIFFLRLISTIITFIVYMVFTFYSNFAVDATYVMALFGIYLMFNSFVGCYYSLFQSNERMQHQTIGNVIYSVSVLLIILFVIFERGTVITITAGYPIAMFLSFIYCTYIAINKYPKFSVCLKKSFLKNIIVKGIPFGITSVFTSIYFWIALIILTYMAGSTAVGLFSSSQKLLLVFSTIFYLFSNAVFPIMSELFTVDKEKLRDLYYKLMKYLLILGMSLAVGTYLYSKDIIYIVYGAEYVVGANSLSILIWAGMFMFLSGLSSTLLGAINKQFSVTKNAFLGALFSVVFNSTMIYFYSYIGASVSTVCTEFMILVLMWYTLSKTEFHLTLRKSIMPIIQVIVSNIAMAACLMFLNLPFAMAVPVATIIYIIALLATKAINKEDLEIIFGFVNDFKNRNN